MRSYFSHLLNSLHLIDLQTRTKDRFFYYALLTFCALLPFQFALNPQAGVDLAIVRVFLPLLFLGYLAFALKNRLSLLSRDNTTKALLVFLVFAILSLLFSVNLGWSLRKLLFPISLLPTYLLALSILNTAARRRMAIFALVSGATVLAWLAVLQFAAQFVFGIDAVSAFLGDHLTPFFLGKSFSQAVLAYPSWLINSGGTTYMRATAIFPDPHMLSYYFGLLIPWSLALWATTAAHKRWLFLSVFSLIVADVLTFTRGGYLALIASAIIILPLVSKKTALKIVAGAGVVLFLFTVAPHNPVAGRLASSFDVQEGSNQGRLNNWQQALVIISAHPFGVGIGSYSLAVKSTATYREPIYAHNLYLDIAAELGIPAALLFIAILWLAFKRFWDLSKKQPFFLAGVSSITLFATHSLVENPLYSVHVLPLFLIILALSIPAKLYEENRN